MSYRLCIYRKPLIDFVKHIDHADNKVSYRLSISVNGRHSYIVFKSILSNKSRHVILDNVTFASGKLSQVSPLLRSSSFTEIDGSRLTCYCKTFTYHVNHSHFPCSTKFMISTICGVTIFPLQWEYSSCSVLRLKLFLNITFATQNQYLNHTTEIFRQQYNY